MSNEDIVVPSFGIVFIACCEGRELKAYQDHGGRGWVCGHGHSNGAGPPRVEHDTIWTPEECWRVLLQDVVNSSREVRNIVKVSLTPSQFTACVSLDLNKGATQFKKTRVVQFLNDKHMLKAGLAFMDDVSAVDRDTGIEREFDGLKARRIMESSFFLRDFWPPPFER